MSRNKIYFLAILFTGVALRMLVATRGYNTDMMAYMLVANIVDHGNNVYLETYRYNYAPFWSNLLYVLFVLSQKNLEIFRYTISAFLTLADIGIFAILWKRFGKKAAFFFFLNPISIIITGYHCQFDNLALVMGMLSTLFWVEDEESLSRKKILSLILLGFSLMIKHVLFAFPLWLAFKQKGLFKKALVLFLPVSIFLVSFLPYWAEGKSGIIDHVFKYTSWENAVFYQLFVPGFLKILIPPKILWLGSLIFFAYYYRHRNGFDSLLLYSVVMVAAAPAVTNQYLSIPVAFTSVYPNPFLILYTALTTFYFLFDKNGLALVLIPWDTRNYTPIIILMVMGFIWFNWGTFLFNQFKGFFSSRHSKLNSPTSK